MSIKVGVILTEPSASKCGVNPRCPSRGFGIDVTAMVCETLHLNCTFIAYEDQSFGDANESGQGSGMIGAIQRGEFDTSLPVFTPSISRLRAVEFSEVYFFDDLVMVTRAPTPDYSQVNWSILYAFQWPIWFLLVLAFLVLLTATTVFGHRMYLCIGGNFQNSKQARNRKPIDLIRGIARMTFYPSLLRFDSFRLVVAFWALTYIILGKAYTGVLFSLKISHSATVPFKDLESFADCLDTGGCKLIMPTLSVSYMHMLTSSADHVTSRMGTILARPGTVQTLNETLIPRAILDTRDTYLVWMWNKIGVNYQIGGNEACLYYFLDLPYKDITAFPVRKNSSLLRKLDRMAAPFMEGALGRTLQLKYLSPAARDDFCKFRERGRRSWLDDGGGLYAMRTTFLLYVLGASVAIIGLSVEVGMQKFYQYFTDSVFKGHR